MRLNSGSIALLCVVCSMAVVAGTSRQALAMSLACCNEVTYECQFGTGSPQWCPDSCPVGWQLCSDTIGITCGTIVGSCQKDCACYRDIDAACCAALGGVPVRHCQECVTTDDPDVAVQESQEDDYLLPDEELEEELDAPAPFSNAWALAIPAFLFLPVVPVMLRRRRNG